MQMKGVMTVSKGRSVHGQPCSLSVASWMLLLVLLLSSSFSQIHKRSREQALEEDSLGTHEILLDTRDGSARSYGRGNPDPLRDQGQGFSLDCRTSLQLAEASGLDWLDTYSESQTSQGLRDDDEEILADQLAISQVTSPSHGNTIDALQYAEYGAGLLQKSGAAEESFRICLRRDSGVCQCPGGNDCRDSKWEEEIPPLLGDPCSSKSLAEGYCHIVKMYAGEVVREVEPGESHLLCRRSALSETVLCEIAFSSITECFKTGIDSKFCPYDGSLLNLLPSPDIRQRPAEHHMNYTESMVPCETKEANLHGSRHDEVEIQTLVKDELTSFTSDVEVINLNPLEDKHGETKMEIEAAEQGSDSLSLVENEKQEVGSKDSGQPLSQGNFEVDTDNRRLKDDEALSSQVHILAQPGEDGYTLVDKGTAASQQITLETEIADGFQPQELQPVTNIQQEWPLIEETIVPVQVENGRISEPVKLRRVGTVMSLDEYKRSILEKQQKLGNDVNLSLVQTQKLRQSDETYNYAASSHGAKVLSSNKEAKGPSHIISSDKDKYLRNPCSAEDKHVVIELSEETFVDTVVISNFEFHSANLKDFEVFGSPVYPAKEWILLGKFRAENVRHRQKFRVDDPKLVRYLKLKMLTHWGSEFFCTLSAVEVFGVDVIKNLLADWIADDEGENVARTQIIGHPVHHEENVALSLSGSALALEAASTESSKIQPSIKSSTRMDSGSQTNRERTVELSSSLFKEEDPSKVKAGDAGPEKHHPAGGKTPGDSVLKLLMQKVKALETSQSLFYNYLEDIHSKYKAMLGELDKDLALMTERVRDEAAVSASLVRQLDDMELKRREERGFVEHKFALITINFTENIDFMRWQIQSMERREITAVMLALLCMTFSALLHLLASCLPRRVSSEKNLLQTTNGASYEQVDACNFSLVCKQSSYLILCLASGLTILVLTV